MFLDLAQAGVDQIYRWIPQPHPDPSQVQHTHIIGHRGGCLDWPENTLEAFEKAHQAGIEGIEFDIRWTKDLVPVLSHDSTLERVFGKKIEVRELSFEELRSVEPRVPSLQEVVTRLGQKIHLMIELKNEKDIDLFKQKRILSEVLSPLDPMKDFHFLGIEPEVFEKYSHFDSRTYLFVAFLNVKELGEIVRKKNYGGITGHYLLLTDRFIESFQKEGLKVGTGFVSSQNVLKRELARGVDWIFTDHVQLVDQFRKRLRSVRE